MHQHTNLLINETSPYLLQHAHNPVQWHAWGNDALEKAKAEDKPILVSIGYAACHWCHVMERESFENEDTAAIMNEHFVNIKIDREERPDIDHIYMDALQAMTGSGGWPLNIFLLPDGRPFYGGTYFPPVKAYSRSSWTEILIAVSNAFKTRRQEIESQAINLTQHLKQSNEFKNSDTHEKNIFTQESVDTIVENLLKAADKTWGGFGPAPKFPQTFSLQFLLRNFYYTNNSEALNHVTQSLKKMMYGGIYDHLKGGFARYSTDEMWFAPHFEKMLYDNALLIIVLSETYQVTKDPVFSKAIEETLQWVNDELTNHEGAYYSAIDADSEGIEGKFYIWTKTEVENILEDDAPLFCSFYDITDKGNWEHANILWMQKSVADYAIEFGYNEKDLNINLQKSKEKLLAVRNNRVRPLLDDKIIVGWNALMNIAYCKAFAATGIEAYKAKAVKNIEILEKYFKNTNTGFWSHTYKNGIAKYPAFLDDYAYLISAYIHLQEITSNQDYLIKAYEMTQLVFDHFDDDESAQFYYTGVSQKDVIIRKKEIYDGATPSANSIMAVNLYYLSVVFDNSSWRERAEIMIKNIASNAIHYPTSFGVWSTILQDLFSGIPEIVLTGSAMEENLNKVLSQFIPGRILQSSAISQVKFPLLKDKAFSHENNIYVCKNQVCAEPVKNADLIKTLLK